MRVEQAREIPRLVAEWGITTYKLYMHMRLGRQHLAQAWTVAPLLGVTAFDDALPFHAMREVARLGAGGLVSLHCESWEIARLLEAELKQAGRTDWAAWHDRSPGELETVHIRRYAALAKALGCRVHIQHVTTAESAAAVREARLDGTDIHGQTGMHYLVLDASAWKINVPLRPASEHEGLWEALARGDVDAIGSDHIGPRRDERTGHIQTREEMARPSVWEAKSGFPSRVEAHLPLLLSEGVNKGRLSLERACAVASENPARIWNLYPRKGALQVGSDADLVVVDLEKKLTLGRDMVVSASGWSYYEGMELKGWPVATVLRGELAAEWTGRSCWVSPEPRGRFFDRRPDLRALGAA
jgi:dihydropyrimidinase/dihydroorotase